MNFYGENRAINLASENSKLFKQKSLEENFQEATSDTQSSSTISKAYTDNNCRESATCVFPYTHCACVGVFSSSSFTCYALNYEIFS